MRSDWTSNIADFTAAIHLPGAPADEVADARFHRGLCWSQKGDTDEAMADYAAVIDMPEAPAELVAKAREALDEIKAKQAPS